MSFNDHYNKRDFHCNKPGTSEETIAAIYEELSVTPLDKNVIRPAQTIKGYLQSLDKNFSRRSRDEENKLKLSELAETMALRVVGLLGLLLVFISSNTDKDWEWWQSYSYFFFVMGLVLVVIYVSVFMESTNFIRSILKFNSAKFLCVLIFSAGVVYASSQASSILNSIFRIDGSNFPYARAILTAIYFLKMCPPFLLILALFALIHGFFVGDAVRNKKDLYLFPWNSVVFFICSIIVASFFWWLTHTAFGDMQIRYKAYKLAHYLDFNNEAYCVNSSYLNEGNHESYLFFGQDQNKVLIDQKIELKESFEQFLKENSIFGDVIIPSRFKIVMCSPVASSSEMILQ
jgi:hypothetical protein